MTSALAFYKGKGTWLNRAIRLVTRSQYSHVEYIHDVNDRDLENRYECRSSSARDGGVRCKRIALKAHHWNVVHVNWTFEDPRIFFALRKTARYSYLGILMNHFFAFHRYRTSRWFCSEIVGYALELPHPQIYSPGTLKKLVDHVNKISHVGYNTGIDVGKKIGLKNV